MSIFFPRSLWWPWLYITDPLQLLYFAGFATSFMAYIKTFKYTLRVHENRCNATIKDATDIQSERRKRCSQYGKYNFI